MGTVITRSFKDSGSFLLSEEARKRATEHLKSLGYREEELQPIEWPEDAVSAYREHMYAPWQFTTKSDIRRQRRERMEHHLWWKREYGVIERRALYVWVFWCPGLFGFAYRGWWVYLIGRGIESGKYLEQDTKTMSRLMELFPLVESTLFGSPDIAKWKKEFVKRYRRGTWAGRPQAKAPVWAEVEGTRIRRILGRAKWPAELRFNT